MIPTTGFLVVSLILLSLRTLFSKLLALLAIPRLVSHLKLPLQGSPMLILLLSTYSTKRVQKGISHWDKQNNDVPAPNCMLKV